MADPEPSVVRAFVLAAGLGTRLRPLTRELPKPAWPLFDVPLAARVLADLARVGVREALVNLHHLPERLRTEVTPWLPAGLRVRWSPETEILGTGGALVPWRDTLSAGPFFLANADTYQELDFAALARFHRERSALATLVVRLAPPGAGGPLEVGADGRVVRFLGSRAPGGGPGRACEFSGVHLLEPAILAELPGGAFCINADVHARLVGEGAPLFAFLPGAGFWSDLGTPERYLGAHRALLAGGELPPGSPGRAILRDEHSLHGGRVLAPSYLGPRTRVEDGAVAGPCAVLGAGSRVGPGARVEDAVLWAGARVEGGCLRGAVVSASGARLEVRP